MRTSAVTRRKLRRWAGALGISLGTAVFSGAVAILVDSFVRGGSLHWAFLIGFTAIGLMLSGSGSWLLATAKSAVGVSVAAMDHAGDIERYQDETDSFARFGREIFTAQTSVNVSVENTGDLRLLRARLRSAIRTLIQAEQRASQTGVLFQGRAEVGFHLGRWLNQASGRIHLYSDSRGGGPESHFAAIRLTPALGTPPRQLDTILYRTAGPAFGGPQRTGLADLRDLLTSQAGTCMGLGVNLNGPADEAGFVEAVLSSAASEDASAVVFVAPPAPPGDDDAPGRQLAPTCQEFESTVAAIVATAKRMRAAPGLLYMKTPAVIPVALGRYLYGNDWIPMRHFRDAPGNPVKYESFIDTSQE